MFHAFILFILIFVILLYKYLVRNFNYWKNQNIPYIKPVPIFGNIFSVFTIKKSIWAYLSDLYSTTVAPVIGFFVFDQPFLLIRDPQLIKNILVTDFNHFCDRSFFNYSGDKYSGKTLFLLKNPSWKVIRTKATPAFTSGKLKRMVPLIVESSKEMLQHVQVISKTQKSIECRDLFVKFSIDVISLISFGFEAKSHHNSNFAKAAQELTDGISIWRSIQMASYLYAPVLVKMFQMKFHNPDSAKFLEKIFLNEFRARKNTKPRGDLIDLLIKTNEDDPTFDNDYFVSMALQFLIAGFETSGVSVALCLYELCINESVQIKLRNEILEILKKHNQMITFESIAEMKYLEMVILETLRKYPPLPYVDRRCTKTYTVPNSEITIKKGIPIYISTISLHYDSNYFPDPKIFNPERFAAENKSNIRPFTYMPFGQGYRYCIGEKLGMLMVSVALIQVLTHYKVELSEDISCPLTFCDYGVVIIPTNGVRLKLIELHH